MSPDDFPTEAEALCTLGRLFGDRGWCLATSGNFSLRVGGDRCLITQSGRDKSRLSRSDLMICDFDGTAADKRATPSAETPLHTSIYRLGADVGAVLHTHSVFATVMSRATRTALTFSGFEMQKAIAGIRSHDDAIDIAVFDNDQDMPALAGKVAAAWAAGNIAVPGFLIRGHGLYAWGTNLDEAQRHVEAYEFLLQCAWQDSLANAP